MKDTNRSVQPWLLGVFSALVLGVVSFFIWFLRLISNPAEERRAIASSVDPFRTVEDTDNPLVENPTVLNPALPGGADVHPVSTNEAASQPEGMSSPQLVSDSTSRQSNNWTAPTRYIAGTGLFLFFLWLLIYSQQSLTILIFAALIAILVRPAVQFLQGRLRFINGLAVILVYLVVTILVFGLPVLFIPNIARAINSFLNYDWQGLLKGFAGTLSNLSTQVATIPWIGAGLANSFATLSNETLNLFTAKQVMEVQAISIEELLVNMGESIGLLGGLIAPLASGFVSLIFMILISLQMSLSAGEIKGWFMKLFSERFAGEIGSLLDRVLLVWVSFLRGQFILMVVMGLITWIFNLLVGTPQALLLGFLAGLLEVIPSLGPILATIPAAILAVSFGSNIFPGLNHWIFMLIVIIGYVLLQMIENQVLVPKILGNAVSLPSLIVLIGVTVAGAKVGILGVFLAAPMMATGKEFLEYVYGKIDEKTDVLAPPDKDQPSLMDQVRSFMGRIRLPIRVAGQVEKGTLDLTDVKG